MTEFELTVGARTDVVVTRDLPYGVLVETASDQRSRRASFAMANGQLGWFTFADAETVAPLPLGVAAGARQLFIETWTWS